MLLPVKTCLSARLPLITEKACTDAPAGASPGLPRYLPAFLPVSRFLHNNYFKKDTGEVQN